MRTGFLFLFLLIFYSNGVDAQFSVKIGYDVGFVKEEPNGIFRRVRMDKPWLNLEAKKLNNLQGVVFGLRYETDILATEFDFNYGFWTVQGSGINPADDRSETLKASLTNGALGFGLEGLFGKFGLGTSIHYHFFSQKGKNSNTGSFVAKSNYLSERVFLGVYLEGSKHTTLALRPYVDFPFGNVNLYSMEEKLNDRAGFSKADFDYKPSAFGIQLLFFNGR
ncbi:MAG TPA: hypothetical protein ENK85_10660 [Saprospiraceae bacterium]|nr:hypothetical protein [Saprospiraceae bacterium]